MTKRFSGNEQSRLASVFIVFTACTGEIYMTLREHSGRHFELRIQQKVGTVDATATTVNISIIRVCT